MVLYGFLFLSFSATRCLFLSVHLPLCLCQFFIILSLSISISISLLSVSFYTCLSLCLCSGYLPSLSACLSISLLLPACFFVCMYSYQFQLLFVKLTLFLSFSLILSSSLCIWLSTPFCCRFSLSSFISCLLIYDTLSLPISVCLSLCQSVLCLCLSITVSPFLIVFLPPHLSLGLFFFFLIYLFFNS